MRYNIEKSNDLYLTAISMREEGEEILTDSIIYIDNSTVLQDTQGENDNDMDIIFISLVCFVWLIGC